MPSLDYDWAGHGVEGASISPTRRSAGATGSGVDFGEADGPVSAVWQIGNLSNQVVTLTLTLTESENDNTADAWGAADTYTALSPAASTTATASDENTVIVYTTFARSKRYVRAAVTHSGTALQDIYGVSLHSRSKSY